MTEPTQKLGHLVGAQPAQADEHWAVPVAVSRGFTINQELDGLDPSTMSSAELLDRLCVDQVKRLRGPTRSRRDLSGALSGS